MLVVWVDVLEVISVRKFGGGYCVGLQRFVASPRPSPSLRFWRGGLNGLLTFLLDYLVFGYRSVPFSQVKERGFGMANGVKGRSGFLSLGGGL